MTTPLPTLTAADFEKWIKSPEFEKGYGCPLERFAEANGKDVSVGEVFVVFANRHYQLTTAARRFVAAIDSCEDCNAWRSRPACLRALRRAVRETSGKERAR